MRGVRLAGLLLVLASHSARADDWLAVLPDCEKGERPSLPSFALVYPRPGLPALVSAGETLIARVRLPVALTPPPGIQQARALVGWRARLVRRALAPAAEMERFQYPLEVVDVRPDGASSLVYRASLPVPAWVAPGSYDLVLHAPGGGGMAPGLVRVLRLRGSARLAFIADEDPPTHLAVAGLPFDVWLRSRRTQAADPTDRDDAIAGPPVLDLEQLIAALRVDGALLVSGACESPFAQRRFADEITSVLDREHSKLVSSTELAAAHDIARGQFRPETGAPHAWPDVSALVWSGTALTSAASYPNAFAEVAILLPRDLRLDGPAKTPIAFFPSADVGALAADAPSVALLRLARGARAGVAHLAPPDWHAKLDLPANAVESFAPFRLRVVGAPGDPVVAWRFDERRTAYGPLALERSFTSLGPHRIDALVLAQDGSAQQLGGRVLVRTAQRSGCRCGLGARPSRLAGAWAVLAFGVLCSRLSARRSAEKTRRAARPE